MNHHTGQLTSADGLSLFVQTWIGSDRPQGILLLVHGLGEHSDRYQNYVNYFAPRGYVLCAFDLRGHGRSGGRRVYVDRFQQYVNDLALLVAHIRSSYSSQKPFIMGHILGSLIALSYGLQHPDDIAGVIVTGIALRSAISIGDIPFSYWTIVLGHATFCVVVVYNNVLARLRRFGNSLIEASMDLGANGFQTFRHILLPHLSTALLAGGMLAFALSFDEVIVTTFTSGQQMTLPIWIFSQLTRPRDRPVTNVVAIVVILFTFIPILIAHRLTRDSGGAHL